MIEPHCPKIIFAFTYRHCRVEIDRDEWEGRDIYAVWVSYDLGSALAVPYAPTLKSAVRKAKRWIDGRYF
ncbi:MAG: hypothetical protein AAGA60_07220 [Cyanobacteria bacterium P01_E01_bin.42]